MGEKIVATSKVKISEFFYLKFENYLKLKKIDMSEMYEMHEHKTMKFDRKYDSNT